MRLIRHGNRPSGCREGAIASPQLQPFSQDTSSIFSSTTGMFPSQACGVKARTSRRAIDVKNVKSLSDLLRYSIVFVEIARSSLIYDLEANSIQGVGNRQNTKETFSIRKALSSQAHDAAHKSKGMNAPNHDCRIRIKSYAWSEELHKELLSEARSRVEVAYSIDASCVQYKGFQECYTTSDHGCARYFPSPLRHSTIHPRLKNTRVLHYCINVYRKERIITHPQNRSSKGHK